MTGKRLIGQADIFMITACFLWAIGTVVSKNALGTTPDSFRVTIFNGLRFPIATLLLFTSLKISGSQVAIRLKHIPGFAIVSFFGMFLFMVLFHTGLLMTTASNTGIIIAVIPLVIVMISFFSGVEKPNRWLISGIIMGFCGVVVMNLQYGGLTINNGILLVFLSCFCWGIYAVYGEKYMRLYPPIVTTAWIFLFTTLFHVPIFIHQFPAQSWAAISGWNWFNLVFAAVVPLFIANTLYFASIHKIGSSRSGIYIYLEPVFTVILAFVIRNEDISLLQIIGFITICAGVYISKIQGTKT